MNLSEFIELLSNAGAGGFVVIVVQHFLSSSDKKKQRVMEIKREAYARAHSSLVRLRTQAIPHWIDTISGNSNSYNDFLNKLSKEISQAILYSSKDVFNLLSEAILLLEQLRSTGYRTNIKNLPQAEAEGVLREADEISKKIDALEKKIIEAMRKDLNSH